MGLLVLLMRALARLALPADAQISYLRALGVLPLADELALEFTEGAALAPQFVAAGWLDQADADAIVAVDNALNEMSGAGRKDLWTESALRTAPEWESVRRLATEAILR